MNSSDFNPKNGNETRISLKKLVDIQINVKRKKSIDTSIYLNKNKMNNKQSTNIMLDSTNSAAVVLERLEGSKYHMGSQSPVNIYYLNISINF